MGFLDSLGAGLRYGGGALAGAVSPDVYREQSHERARVKESGRDRQAKAAEIMLRAAHSGQIPEDKLPELQQSLAKMGYELPIEALSPSPEARQKLSEYARKKADLEKADAAGTELANFGQPEGIGLPEQGLRGNAPAPLPQVPMPPRPQGMAQGQPLPGAQTFPLVQDPQGIVANETIPQQQAVVPARPAATGAERDSVFDSSFETAYRNNPDNATPESQRLYNESPVINPPEVMPAAPNAAMQQEPIEQLPQEVVIGKRGTIPPIVQNEIAQAIPQGTSKVDLWEWRKRALNSARRGVPGAKEELEHVLKLMNPKEGKTHVIDGSLVDDSGRVIYKGSPAELKIIQEHNALLDASGITDPKERRDSFAAYTARKGSGGNTNVNFGGLTAGVDANGNPVFAQSSNKGGAQIVEGFTPAIKEKPEKVLPTKAMENVSNAASAAEDTEESTNSFKPEYGGHFILGKLSNTIGRTVGDDSGQAQWWQALEARTNIARHELFGSALTRTELNAWNATAVNPSMNAGEIKKNLERRQVIERRAVAKLAKSYMAQGYSKEGIRELLGSNADYILDNPTPTVAGEQAKGLAPTATLTVAPKGFPPGSKPIGKSPRGKDVWLTPDGRTITAPD